MHVSCTSRDTFLPDTLVYIGTKVVYTVEAFQSRHQAHGRLPCYPDHGGPCRFPRQPDRLGERMADPTPPWGTMQRLDLQDALDALP
jgi:hypothetical protein